jgi:hypothetical protein
MFTQYKDYKLLISEENLEVVIDGDSSLLRKMELTAQEEIESYLRHHFDVGLLFAGFQKWNNSIIYLADNKTLVSFVNDEDDLWFVNTDTVAGESPTTAPTKWTKSDNRHQYLLTIYIDITLYHAHSRINPRNIPEFRIQRYDDAISWLKMVNAGKVTPDFPIKDPLIVEGRNIQTGQSLINENTY